MPSHQAQLFAFADGGKTSGNGIHIQFFRRIAFQTEQYPGGTKELDVDSIRRIREGKQLPEREDLIAQAQAAE